MENSMLLIIEGPDCSGKSYLINYLIKEFPGLLFKITDKPKDGSIDERRKIINHYWSILDFTEKDRFQYYILDRFFPSEIVYSVKRGYDAKDDLKIKLLEYHVSKRPHLFIYCNPGEKIILERMENEIKPYVSKDENVLMLNRYNEYFEKTILNKLMVDTSKQTEETINQIKDKIIELYGKREKHRPNHSTQLNLFGR